MAELRLDKSRYRVDNVRKWSGQERLEKADVAARISGRAAQLGFKQSELATALEIPKTTMGRIWKGENLPDSATLFPLSDLLGVSPRWLLYGGDADPIEREGDTVRILPLFDLARISRRGKGDAKASFPILREWLERKIRTDETLWLTEMPNDLLDDVAAEGEMIVCSDIAPEEAALADGRVYVLLLDDQPVIRRVSFEPDAILLSTSNERLPPIRLPRGEAGGTIHPIARVRGALLLKAL